MKIKKDFNEGYIEGVYDERKRVLEIIDKWSDDNFFYNECEDRYEEGGLSVHIEDLKQEISKTEGAK
jgi:hypothetical protein